MAEFDIYTRRRNTWGGERKQFRPDPPKRRQWSRCEKNEHLLDGVGLPNCVYSHHHYLAEKFGGAFETEIRIILKVLRDDESSL